MRMANKKNFFSTFQNEHTERFISEKKVLCEADLEINCYDLPPYLREEQYDAVLIYCQKNEKEAILFKSIIEKFITLEDEKLAKVCTLDGTDYLHWVQSKFKHLEEAVARSTYMFLFMSDDFVSDSWADLQKDECLQESIANKEKKWCVVPVHTLPKEECHYKIPWGLRSLKGLYVNTLLKGKWLRDIEFHDLTEHSLDPFFIKSMSKLLNCRLSMKINRIKAQEQHCIEWKKVEYEKRQKSLAEYRHREEIKEIEAANRRQQQEREYLKAQENTRKALDSKDESLSGNINAESCYSNPITASISMDIDPEVMKFYQAFKQLGKTDSEAMFEAFQAAEKVKKSHRNSSDNKPQPHIIYNFNAATKVVIGDGNTQNINNGYDSTASHPDEVSEDQEVIIERKSDNVISHTVSNLSLSENKVQTVSKGHTQNKLLLRPQALKTEDYTIDDDGCDSENRQSSYIKDEHHSVRKPLAVVKPHNQVESLTGFEQGDQTYVKCRTTKNVMEETNVKSINFSQLQYEDQEEFSHLNDNTELKQIITEDTQLKL